MSICPIPVDCVSQYHCALLHPLELPVQMSVTVFVKAWWAQRYTVPNSADLLHLEVDPEIDADVLKWSIVSKPD